MANALLGYNNLIDGATLSGGSWFAALPLTNLQDRRLGVLARSTDATTASTKFDTNLGSAQSIRIIALVNHNLSNAATFRVKGSSSSSFATTVYDSGALDVWPAAYLATVTDNGTGIWTRALCLPSATSAQYWRVEITDTANTAGYVQFGRLFIGPAWQPEINIAYNGGITVEDTSVIQTAIGGADYFDERPRVRILRFSTNYMTEADAMNYAYEIQNRMGVTSEVFVVWNPDDTTHAPRRQFLARLRSLSAITNPYADQWNNEWEAKELV